MRYWLHVAVISTPLLPSQKAILRTLRKSGPSSRAEIGRVCHLSSGAITRFGRELIDLGLIFEEAPSERSGPGRPTQRLALRGEAGAVIGFAIHPGWIEAVSMDFRGAEVLSRRLPGAEPLALADAVQSMKEFIRLHRSKAGLPILGVGVAVPGYVTRTANQRHTVKGLEDWRPVDLTRHFTAKLGYDVLVENDASATALAEYYDLAARDAEVVMAVTLGPGVGGGVVANGRLLRGAHGNAGEIGWLYPYGEPRPSARDFFACIQAALPDGATLAALELEERDIKGVIEVWCRRAAEQLRLAVGPGGGWLDPDRIVLAGPLPIAVLARTARLLGETQLFEPEVNISRPQPQGSALGARAAAVGAALLPFQAMLDV